MQKVLITAKVNPDIDGVACGIGYAEFLNKTRKDILYEAGFEGDEQIEVKFTLKKAGVNFPQITSKYDSYILVDFSAKKGLPSIVDPSKVQEFVDHRAGHVEYEVFPNAKAQIEFVGAAATLIAEKFYFADIDLEKSTAMLLYLAIFSNSLNLKARVTTFRDIQMVDWLENKFKDCSRGLVSEMFDYKTDGIIKNLKFALNSDSKQIKIAERNIGMYQLEVFGVDKLIPSKVTEMIKIMRKIKKNDWSFCTIADMKGGRNYILLTDISKSSIFKDIVGAKEKGEYLVTDSLYLRKEIIPELQSRLR